MLFDWLVTGHVIDVNPAHAVHRPKHVVKKGKTPVLASDEARTLLDSIETESLIGRRDRALIAVMVYTFASINAVLEMKCGIISCRAAAAGCACTKKAANSTRCPVTTISKST